MLDLIAAISSVDPPVLLAWLILAFAASGYPLGIMLGSSCSPCCGPSTPCSLCTEGELPETLTVTFDGLQDRTPGPDLCLLTFSAPYGSGAAGKVTAPGGDPDADKGPITAVSLTNGGSGYAKLGRVAPTITASGGSGTGATFSVSTTSANDANGIPSWSVTGVTVTGTPTGYADGDQITFSAAAGDTEEQAAAATINTTRAAPTLSASASTGTGATFSISYTANGGSPATWSVSGVTVTAGGTGYADGSALTLSLGSGDKVDSEAYATILTNRLQPTLTASVTSDDGTGAALSVSLTQTTDYDGRAVWNVSGITATTGGSDYVVGDPVSVTVTDGQETYYSYFSASVSSVDGGGAITGITIDYGGEYFKDGGVIQSVAVYGGGTYYKDDGVITGVTVDAGGAYYREDADEEPYVATVMVGVSQAWPSAGTGATLTVTVEGNTASANFGKITGVTITSGGTDYLAYELLNSCLSRFDGRSIVCRRSTSNPCVFTFSCATGSCMAEQEAISVTYAGPESPLVVSLFARVAGFDSRLAYGSFGSNLFISSSGSMQSTSLVLDCSAISLECAPVSGVPLSATASIVSGGTYEATNTCLAIQAEDLDEVQVAAEWGGESWGGAVGRVSSDPRYCGGSAAFTWGGDSASSEPGKSWTIGPLSASLSIKGCGLIWTQFADHGSSAAIGLPGLYLEQQTSSPFSIIKTCGWSFSIVDVPVDEDGLPSGEAVIVNIPSGTSGDCPYPGIPTISFSRLP